MSSDVGLLSSNNGYSILSRIKPTQRSRNRGFFAFRLLIALIYSRHAIVPRSHTPLL